MQLFGIDFTSRPSRRKPITVACGQRLATAVRLEQVLHLYDFPAFEQLLAQPGPWLAACDFPFGLPRELVETLAWPPHWPSLMQQLGDSTRSELVAQFKAFCAARPAGHKFAHRACDRYARSSPSMKWVNPPVAFMLKEGAPRLLAAGVSLPGLCAGDPQRVALEGYPALLARSVLGQTSYKSDGPARHDEARRQRRARLLNALRDGEHALGLRLELDESLAQALIAEGSADQLDAVLCLLQAAWASQQPGYGLPAGIDPLEGWIVSTPGPLGH